MVSLFLHTDYRAFLKSAIEQRKTHRKLTLRDLAQSAGIQPTYLTNVLMNRANLNQDQLYALGEALDLTKEERDFSALLLEMDRASNPNRKKEILQQIEKIQKGSLKTAKHLPSREVEAGGIEEQEYYLEATTSLVHVFLRVPKYAKNPKLIGEELKLSPSKLQQTLKLLEKNGFIRWDAKHSRYSVEKHTRHLSAESPLCFPHQLLMRLSSLQRIQILPTEDRNTISITYFANKEVRREIHSEFLSFLKKADKLVADSKDDNEVFQMNFDLFPWSNI